MALKFSKWLTKLFNKIRMYNTKNINPIKWRGSSTNFTYIIVSVLLQNSIISSYLMGNLYLGLQFNARIHMKPFIKVQSQNIRKEKKRIPMVSMNPSARLIWRIESVTPSTGSKMYLSGYSHRRSLKWSFWGDSSILPNKNLLNSS